MRKISPEEYAHIKQPEGLEQVWKDDKFLVQVYAKEKSAIRLSVTKIGESTLNREFPDGITWDELNAIKTEVGFGNFDAVEIYPKQKDVVNVANMRHLWILDKPLPFIWRKK